MSFTRRVTAAIERHFSGADRAAVAEALGSYFAGGIKDTERIQLLILRLSRRNVDHVRKLVRTAQRDYRDLIVMESHPMRLYLVGLLRRGRNASQR